jgi:hypothetical protein
MRKPVFIVLVAIVLGLLIAPDAAAQAGIVRWIAKLSGPGPIEAYGYELYPLCVGKKTGRTRAGGQPMERGQIDAQPFGPDFDLNCRSFSRDHPLVKIGFQMADFRGDNQLEYDPSVPESLTDTVRGKLYSLTGDVSLVSGTFDLGGAIGRMHFTGAPAGPVTHPLYEIRGTLNIVPLVNWKRVRTRAVSVPERYRMDWVQFRVSINIVPGGLEDTDFGAIPGTFGPTDTEVSVRPTILVNLGNLFDW